VRSRINTWLVAAALVGCHHATPATKTKAGEAPSGSVATVAGPSAEANDAGPPAPDAPRVWATALVAPIFSAMEWPPKDPEKAEPSRKSVTRLGYTRSGESVVVKSTTPTKKPNCPEGWYELDPSQSGGGFICGQFVTTDSHAEGMLEPPSNDGPLPYKYGLNLTNGAPLYRRIPTKREREENEKHLLVGRSHPGDLARAQQGAMEEDGGVPWYLQDHKGQRPQVTFDDIRGNGLVVLRMIKGFYLGLDGEVTGKHAGGKLWRTTSNEYVPEEHVIVHKSVTEFEGVDFRVATETRKLPLAWVLNPHAWKYQIDEGEKKAHRKDHVDRFTIVELTGKQIVIDNRHYWETKDSYWLKDVEATMTNPGKAPADLAPNEKWIDVNLALQSLVAFEGDKPIYATIISSGRHNDEDKTKDHRTITGSFRIREKHIAATMDDDSASDGPYSIQDVPWIMYFHGGIALHGAFWHSSFGHERSHGCVNLTPYDAKSLFQWTGPRLPEGWHGIHATDANPGTRVIVHD
jgi:lipoprotein-anchoring transpeptidase ErfK/SrfK